MRFDRVCREFLLGLAVTAMLAAQAHASTPESVPPLFLAESLNQESPRPAPLGSEATTHLAPAAVLAPAAIGAWDELAALRAWNDAGKRPLRAGFSRPLPAPIRLFSRDELVSDEPPNAFLEQRSSRSVTRATRVQVADAHRLRLRLSDVSVPPDTKFWVYGATGSGLSFGTDLVADGVLWTPSVEGDVITLEVELAIGGRAHLVVDQVAEILPLDQVSGVAPLAGECLGDATCITGGTLDVIAEYRRAVAHLQYIKGGQLFACTGGLLNDTVSNSVIPYLLTANHCIASQGVASTLEAFWDYKTSTCGGAFPNLGGLPRSNGSTLMATGASTDFTLLRLNSIPGNRYLLGWNAAPSAVGHGSPLHRISHPIPSGTPFPQAYSRTVLSTTASPHPDLPRPRFLYANLQQGGVFGGSSGAPVIIPGGYVVGQLYGQVGINPGNGCDASNSVVDGAFSQTFPHVSQFLAPSQDCVEDLEGGVVCLQNGRFRIRTTYLRFGVVEPYRLDKVNDSVVLGNYNHQPTNLVTTQKVVDNCTNDVFTFWWAGMTLYESVVEVTDLERGETRFYGSPAGGNPVSIRDATWPCN